MASMIASLPYRQDSASLFGQIAHEPWAIFLDSGRTLGQDARYDILAADPFMTLTTRGTETVIAGANTHETSLGDPFLLLKQVLAEYAPVEQSSLPFTGGALGYFAYDLARRIERVPNLADDAEHLPEMAVGIYDWVVVVDHAEQKSWLVGHGHDPRTEQRWAALQSMMSTPAPGPSASFQVLSKVRSNLDAVAYGQAFEKIQAYIHAGDCYQVNLAQRFCVNAQGDAWQGYQYLRQHSPAPFAAYFNTPEAQILSASPERFLQVRQGKVETKPIKGTRPRGNHPIQDAAYVDELLHSEKDRAENLMIVDLLRNDLGKNCEIGSVRADRLFALESFTHVHHLVSTVTGTLKAGHHAIDLLRGCFPGGSITGAPKLRAMEIIEELEPHRRGVYCGAIGYIGFDGNMDTNIAIRTAVYAQGQFRFWAGGGIVADSEMEKEYRETWDKASNMLQLTDHFYVGG
jgi:para-aminobenzoate synthetase component 1